MNEPTKNDNDSIKTSVSSQNPSESIPSTSESKNFSQNNDVNQQSSSETKPKDYFECNICLDTASEPVLTQCGHLFCWPCIFQWMESDRSMRNACPVCKAGISKSKLIPIYTRSAPKDPRKNIPQRPTPVRPPEPTPRPQPSHETEYFNPFGTTTHIFGNVAVTTTFVPSLFGLHFAFPPPRDTDGQPPNHEQLVPFFISHLLFIFGTLVLLYLFFQ